MQCPNCLIEMAGVKTDSKYGASVFLDQCPSCGGVWLDGDEIYLAKPAGENYGVINDKLLSSQSVPVNADLKCPRDHSLLKLFNDPMFLQSIKVESCSECGGFWFNRGEFKTFQEEREKKRVAEIKSVPKKDTEDEALKNQIKMLLQSEGSGGNYDSLGRMGSFLMTPMGGSRVSRFDIAQSPRAEDWSRLAMMTIRVLLRLVFKI